MSVTASATFDMASALELPMGAENEAKFIAVRNLHLKKVKQLMVSIDAKDKEIAKLKVLGKDNRRTQMIQALRNKIKDLELINDVVKEELVKNTDHTMEEVNGLIIRKTLAGPKRFRPLSREELENKIIELEKKTAVTTTTRGVTSANQPYNSTSASAQQVGQDSKSEAPGKSSARNMSTDEAKGGGISGGNLLGGIIEAAAMIDELHSLKSLVAAKDQLVGMQRDEIVRLRSRNAKLVSLEQEMEFYEKEYKDIKEQNESLAKYVDSLTQQLAAATETVNKYQSEAVVIMEQEQAEIDALHQQCEKLLKQNATLLSSLSDAEHALQRYEEEASQSKQRSTSAESIVQKLEARVKALEERNARLVEKVKMLETRSNTLEMEAHQVTVLKDQLREKNIIIKEMKRKVDEKERIAPGKTSTTNLHAGQAKAAETDSTADAKGSFPQEKSDK